MSNIPKKTKCFDDLPDEIATEIFSYLDLDDLAYSVPRVSSRWKELSQDYTIWKDRVFRHEEDMKDEQTIQFLKNMPALKSFSGTYWPGKNIDSVINTMCTACNELESLHLTGGSDIPYFLLEKLTKTFVQIKHLNIPILKEDDSLKRAQLISKLQNLTDLKFSDRYAKVSEPILKTIADGCPSLKHMDLGDNIFVDEDIRYFLQKKQKQLVSFKIWCSISLLTFNTLVECVNLEELQFYTYNHIPCLTYDDIFSLKKFKKLKKLEVGYYTDKLSKAVSNLFKGCALSSVLNLTLYFLNDFNESHLNQVIMNCPQLIQLRILFHMNLDEALKNIGNCRNLKALGLGGCQTVTAKCLDYVAAGCPNLKYLSLACSLETPDDVMLSVIKLKRLEELEISYSGFTGLYFDLFSTHLLHLKKIVAFECGIENKIWAKVSKDMPLLKVVGLL